jgi:hypothetical protein
MPPPNMTEADARVLLRDCGGFGGLEAWIAGRRWKTVPGGWSVSGKLRGGASASGLSPAGCALGSDAE